MKAAAAQSLDCTHRGDVLRTVACKSCKNSTIEVSVYQCAIYGECTKENYSRNNPELAGLHVCRGCDRLQSSTVMAGPTEPSLPGLVTRAKNFGGAVLRDRIAGKPRRSPELVSRLLNTFCKTCPAYNPTEGACAECGCPVNSTEHEDNKLAWAKEECPLKKWPIQKANLLFYILPLEHPDKLWQWHVAQIRKRLSIFNGRRIVHVATKGGWKDYLALASPEAVVKEFGSDAEKIEFRFVPNSQHQETPAFRAMLREIQSTDASEATFYFHAKGVTRALQDAIKPWCEAIYHHNLDRWEEVRQILTVYPCAGIARQPRAPIHLDGVPGGGPWHFAGTGFWFNHHALFSRPNWDSIQEHTHAVEAYLSTQFSYDSAYCLHGDNAGGQHAGVYSAAAWTNWRKPERVAIAPAGSWREGPDDLTLLVLGHDRERLHWVTELPHIRKVFLPDLDPDNSLAESRIFQRPWLEYATLAHAYAGLCTHSWNNKYAGQCLPLAELDRLERRPDLVWAASLGTHDWLESSERHHPGLGSVLWELVTWLQTWQPRLPADPFRLPSVWSNNLICHRDVLLDLAQFHRRVLPWCLERWGRVPPYEVSYDTSRRGGGPGATRPLSFLAELFTVLYFCTRPDLDIRQIPKAL